jgi:hypothetical protein
MQFTCQAKSDGTISLHIDAHEGTHHAWWSQLQVEIYGPGRSDMCVRWRDRSLPVNIQGTTIGFVLPDDGRGIDLNISQR